MKTKLHLSLLLILIISSNIFSQVSFGSQNIIISGGGGTDAPRSVYTTDIDGDGDQDVLSASQDDHKIAWYENTDGNGTFGPQQIITTSALFARSVYAADIDGDGDQDVLSASSGDSKIAWYENFDGNGTFGTQRTITASANGAWSVYATDVDGDGDLDVLSASRFDTKIAWYENTDGNGTFGPQQIITTEADGAWSVYATDVDGDGDQDVLSAAWYYISWYENTDGIGTFGPQQIITTSAINPTSVYATDVDDDGDQDVLSASLDDDKLAWYENTDGNGTFSTEQIITTQADGAVSVYTTDIDGDGDHDVLSASFFDDKIAWYENMDGNGTFGPQQIITTEADGATSVYATDIDGDGDQDVLSTSWNDNKIAWYENTDGIGTFGPRQIIPDLIVSPWSVFAADIDGDGDQDVLSASSGNHKIAWYENADGNGTFSWQQTITTSAGGAKSVFAADIDGDGDQDVLSASMFDDRIAWYENTDGNGTFGTQLTITTQAYNAWSVYASDIDGDGDQDVLSASPQDDKIAWYENTDGNGTFGPQQIITTSANAATSVYATDIDGDGDQDVLSASFNDHKIAWYENTDGNGNFGPQQIITVSAFYAYSVYATDIDGDGDQDVLSASYTDNKVAWYENTDGNGIFGAQQIITNSANKPVSVYAADIDGDGDQDVLSAAIGGRVAWYENTDGNGMFGAYQLITYFANGANSVFATDFDGDGDLDVLSASAGDNKIVWHENLGPLGIHENNLINFSIYPNPTSGMVSIESEVNIVQIDVTNSLGQMVLTNTNKSSIDMTTLTQGFYILKIKDVKGNLGIKKVLKE